jgi:hypothetical protein
MSEAMRIGVSLDDVDQQALAKVMAAMPGHDEKGRPVGITPQDALRYALQQAAKRLR